MPNTNTALLEARAKKNNEFFTRYEDVENELKHYSPLLHGKSVFCCCNDREDGAFYRYFSDHFCTLGLTRLTANTYSRDSSAPGKIVIRTADGVERRSLQGSGDYRSDEMSEIMDESDVIATNPPFTNFSAILKMIIAKKKQFVLVGPQSAITNRSVFPFLHSGEASLGYGYPRSVGYFISDVYEDYAASTGHKEGYIRVPGVTWYTNMAVKPDRPPVVPEVEYTKERYPKYVNLDAINVGRLCDIPKGYSGRMGVPITYMYRHNPERYEIVGTTNAMAEPLVVEGKYVKSPGCAYIKTPEGKLKGVYSRIVIQERS